MYSTLFLFTNLTSCNTFEEEKKVKLFAIINFANRRRRKEENERTSNLNFHVIIRQKTKQNEKKTTVFPVYLIN